MHRSDHGDWGLRCNEQRVRQTIAIKADAIRGALEGALRDGAKNALLARWWLPKLYFIAFWVDYPSKFTVFGIVEFIEHVTAFVTQRFNQSHHIGYTVVDHKRGIAGRK